MKLSKKRIYLIIIATGLLILIGNPALREIIKKRKIYHTLQKELNRLILQNMALKKELHLLQSSTSYIEYWIRREMGYVKPGEVVYIIRDAKKQHNKP